MLACCQIPAQHLPGKFGSSQKAFLDRDDDTYTCDHYYSLDSLLLYRVALVSYRSSFLCSPDLCRNYLARSTCGYPRIIKATGLRNISADQKQ